MGMNPKEKANQLAEKFITKSIFDMSNEELYHERIRAKQAAKICIDEIIQSIEITTGHCTLNNNDVHEVNTDIEYWEKVSSEVDKL